MQLGRSRRSASPRRHTAAALIDLIFFLGESADRFVVLGEQRWVVPFF